MNNAVLPYWALIYFGFSTLVRSHDWFFLNLIYQTILTIFSITYWNCKSEEVQRFLARYPKKGEAAKAFRSHNLQTPKRLGMFWRFYQVVSSKCHFLLQTAFVGPCCFSFRVGLIGCCKRGTLNLLRVFCLLCLVYFWWLAKFYKNEQSGYSRYILHFFCETLSYHCNLLL